jgi:hypothetical protein
MLHLRKDRQLTRDELTKVLEGVKIKIPDLERFKCSERLFIRKGEDWACDGKGFIRDEDNRLRIGSTRHAKGKNNFALEHGSRLQSIHWSHLLKLG